MVIPQHITAHYRHLTAPTCLLGRPSNPIAIHPLRKPAWTVTCAHCSRRLPHQRPQRWRQPATQHGAQRRSPALLIPLHRRQTITPCRPSHHPVIFCLAFLDLWQHHQTEKTPCTAQHPQLHPQLPSHPIQRSVFQPRRHGGIEATNHASECSEYTILHRVSLSMPPLNKDCGISYSSYPQELIWNQLFRGWRQP